MTATLSQQITAVEVARRIVVGAVKPPRPNSSETKLLAEQLSEAVETLREIGARKP